MAEEPGDDAKDLAAALGHGEGDFAHQADPTPAEDEVEPLGCEGGPELLGRLREDGVRSMGGTAEDTNGLPADRRFTGHFVHGLILVVSCVAQIMAVEGRSFELPSAAAIPKPRCRTCGSKTSEENREIMSSYGYG